MINLSVPDTIDERAINKKKLTPFIIQVCGVLYSLFHELWFEPEAIDCMFCLLAWNPQSSSECGTTIDVLYNDLGFREACGSLLEVHSGTEVLLHIEFKALCSFHYLLRYHQNEQNDLSSFSAGMLKKWSIFGFYWRSEWISTSPIRHTCPWDVYIGHF